MRLFDTGKEFSPAPIINGKNFRLLNFLNFLITYLVNKRKRLLFLLAFILISCPIRLYSQSNNASDSIQTFTLEQCISYAFQNQPFLNQSIINQSIAKTSNLIDLSGWLPQLTLSGSLVHYYQLPTTLAANSVPGEPPVPTHQGTSNTFIPVLSATQTIFAPQLFYAANSASLYVTQAEQITDSTKIFIVTAVSKSFYIILQTLDQINVLKEDTARLGRTVEDTREQFNEGLVDETDYQQSMITLNNSNAQLRQETENVAPAYANLKQLMGYPPDKQFNIAFDTVQIDQKVIIDTTKILQYENRIEYQQLQTAKELQHQKTVYYKLSFLPTISAFYNYYFEYENNSLQNLFRDQYPYSTIGLSFNFPLFTGLSRVESIHRSSLQEDILGLSESSLQSQIYQEYTSALADYKSNLYSWRLQKDNQVRAQKVFDVVELQYEQGVVAYLNLIVAESNLITAKIGYVNALYQLLSSKVDLEKAMGNVSINF